MTQGEVGGHQKMTDDNDSNFRWRGFSYFNETEDTKHHFALKMTGKMFF